MMFESITSFRKEPDVDAELKRIQDERDDRAMMLNQQYWPGQGTSLFVKKRNVPGLVVGIMKPHGTGFQVLEGVVVYEPEQVHEFADVDAVLAAGWVVD